MRKYVVGLGLLVGCLLFSTAARAGTVSISFINNPTGIIGPYIGLVDGKIEDIICDDYLSETYANESWTATVSTLADVSHTKFQNLTGYEEIAFLTWKLLDPVNQSSKTAIQFALWQVFAAPVPFNDILNYGGPSLLNDAQSWLNQASLFVQSPGFNPGMFSTFKIYTSTGNPTCSGGPCPNWAPTPQEFVTYVPEADTLEMLAIGLLLITGYQLYRRSTTGLPAAI